MKNIITLLLLFLSKISFSQKLEKIEIDKFDNSKTVSTNINVLSRTIGIKTLECHGYKISNNTTVNYYLVFVLKSKRVESIDDKENIIFLFKDGSKIEKNYTGKYKIYSTDDNIYYSIKLSYDELLTLKEKVISDIRIETSNSNYDFSIKEKFSDVIPKTAKVLLEN